MGGKHEWIWQAYLVYNKKTTCWLHVCKTENEAISLLEDRDENIVLVEIKKIKHIK